MMGFIIIESPEQILESEGKVTDILFVVDTKIDPSPTQLFLSVNIILYVVGIKGIIEINLLVSPVFHLYV